MFLKDKKRRNKEKDFRLAKYIFTFGCFFGAAATGYFLYETIVLSIATFKENQTFEFVIFLLLSLFLVYLTITLAKQGIQTAKAKNVRELP